MIQELINIIGVVGLIVIFLTVLLVIGYGAYGLLEWSKGLNKKDNSEETDEDIE